MKEMSRSFRISQHCECPHRLFDKLLKSVDRFNRSGLRILRIPVVASRVFSNFLFAVDLDAHLRFKSSCHVCCIPKLFAAVPCQWMRIIGRFRNRARAFIQKDRFFYVFFALASLPTFDPPFTPKVIHIYCFYGQFFSTLICDAFQFKVVI